MLFRSSTLPHLPGDRKIERTIDRTRALIRDANVDTLLKTPDGVPMLMDEIQIGLADMHSAVSGAYFGA